MYSFFLGFLQIIENYLGTTNVLLFLKAEEYVQLEDHNANGLEVDAHEGWCGQLDDQVGDDDHAEDLDFQVDACDEPDDQFRVGDHDQPTEQLSNAALKFMICLKRCKITQVSEIQLSWQTAYCSQTLQHT